MDIFHRQPITSKTSERNTVAQGKDRCADAWHLAEMYYRGDVTAHRTWDEAFRELQHVTRQHEFVTGMYVQAKLNMRSLLDQVFPAYEKVFRDLFSDISQRAGPLSGRSSRESA